MDDRETIRVVEKGGGYYLPLSALLNHPTRVREEILPKFGKLRVTRYGGYAFTIRRELRGDGVETESLPLSELLTNPTRVREEVLSEKDEVHVTRHGTYSFTIEREETAGK